MAKEALLAQVEYSVCGQISHYETSLKRIRRNALTENELQGNVESFPLTLNVSTILQDELNISVNERTRYTLETSAHDVQVVIKNLNGSGFNVSTTDKMERMQPFVQNCNVRRQNLHGSLPNVCNIDNMETLQTNALGILVRSQN